MSRNTEGHRIPKSAIKRKRKVKVTVNDLLTRDDINGILESLNETKPEIQDLIVIYTDKNHERYFIHTESSFISTLTWMLETTKLDMILSADDESSNK